ncbi:MAG: CpsB/CapC family capsule biosynthesis tyrosine phosphatase, partial [Terriglobia bacterium]
FNVMLAGYVPILTLVERLSWIKSNYGMLRRLVRAGVWMQITAGSLTGMFGSKAQYWAERMLDDGYVHLLATDAHDVDRRPPNLSQGFERAANRIGIDAAQHLVVTRPRGVIDDVSPSLLPPPHAASARSESPAPNAPHDDQQHTGAHHAGAGGGRGLVSWLWR